MRKYRAALVNTMCLALVYCAGFFTPHTYAQFSELKVGDLFSIMSNVATIIAAVVAIFALNSWRYQLKHSKIYEIAISVEAEVDEVLIHTANESNMNGNRYIYELSKNITLNRFRLMRRNTFIEEVKELELTYRAAISDLGEFGFIRTANHTSLSEALNKFSARVNSEFT
ncbi:hypothetical protein [Aeromonas veronii]|uniref:hypothetical protein n=1 Tax=Aeromonas veronii TaxID=654 RepID=UPI001010F4FA|nr:hypothetical protein [Aeromonas veronii]